MSKQSDKTPLRRSEERPATSTSADARQSTARRPRLLRRWSVAELIAQAAARPPATAH